MTSETFERALEIHSHRKLCEHESGHAAAALLTGLSVYEARAPYWTIKDACAGDADEPAGQVLIRRDGPQDDPERVRAWALTTLAGPICDDTPGWPPNWPLSLATDDATDEGLLGRLVKALNLDRKGYSDLVQEAFRLVTNRPFEHLQAVLGHLLERHGRLDALALERVKAIAEGAPVEHMTKAATVTATDRGEFTAIAAAYSVDRVKDQIIPGAFAETIDRWRASGKRIPLHWDHKGEAHNVIGSIDPATMSETTEGLRVSGKLDLEDSDTAREAWRSMKNGAMSLSFGYITLKRRKRSDGINELQELDLFEISIVPHPANPDTRIVEMKSLDVVELADQIKLDALREDTRALMIKCMGGGVADDAELLRAKSERMAREFAPVQIASFEC